MLARCVGVVSMLSFPSLICLTIFSRLMEGERSYSTIKKPTPLSQVRISTLSELPNMLLYTV